MHRLLESIFSIPFAIEPSAERLRLELFTRLLLYFRRSPKKETYVDRAKELPRRAYEISYLRFERRRNGVVVHGQHADGRASLSELRSLRTRKEKKPAPHNRRLSRFA